MTDTNTVIDQFNEAFQLRAPEKLVDIIADDCVMEGVGRAQRQSLDRLRGVPRRVARTHP